MAIKEVIAFAASNIALCKYWGKRSEELNLPYNSSLSISLGNKGTNTKLSIINNETDQIVLNNTLVHHNSTFYIRTKKFLDYFRDNLPNPKTAFKIITNSNLPIAAGLASSASGFAALVKALNKLFNWNLSPKELSKLARLASGSACRSIFNGFVKWHEGSQEDGNDSFAEQLDVIWEDLCIGLLLLDHKEKYLSSTLAMLATTKTSLLYPSWINVAQQDLINIESAIKNFDFKLLGETTEANSIAMHALMLTARPPIIYSNKDTINQIQKIWRIRKTDNVPLYFTQDAGPNLKLLFLSEDLLKVKKLFPEIEIITPFNTEYQFYE